MSIATTSAARSGRRWDYRLRDGTPSVGWTAASPGRRLLAWGIDGLLLVGTAGVGWLLWAAWWTWPAGRTPGGAALGLTVFDCGAGRPADRRRMALRALVYQPILLALGVATLGLAWAYCAAAGLGRGRRTILDEWSGTVSLRRPRSTGGPFGRAFAES